MTVHKTARMATATIRCDWRPTSSEYEGPGYCDVKFVSFSDSQLVERQAQHKGWTVKEARTNRHDGVHLCPKHAESPRFMMPQRRP
jgi:hypothetical protein